MGRGGWLESPAQARRRGLVDIALCRVLSDAGLRRSEAAALVWDDVARWDDGSGRLTVGRSKTDAEARTVYLTPASVQSLAAIRPADANGSASVFGLSAPSISRRIQAVAAVAGLGLGFSGHSGRVGMARRMAASGAPTHEIMAQGRWKTARMVEGLHAGGRGGAGGEVAGVGAILSLRRRQAQLYERRDGQCKRPCTSERRCCLEAGLKLWTRSFRLGSLSASSFTPRWPSGGLRLKF